MLEFIGIVLSSILILLLAFGVSPYLGWILVGVSVIGLLGGA